jgi:inhibitor of cysteine peptidase
MNGSSKHWGIAAVVLVVVIAGVAAASAGCGSQANAAETLKLTAADNGKEFAVEVGDLVQVILAGNPTTGYSWTVAMDEKDAALLEPQGDPVYAQESTDPSLVGGGGTYTFTFKAVEAGQPVIRLEYARSFEQGVPPEQEFSAVVIIK